RPGPGQEATEKRVTDMEATRKKMGLSPSQFYAAPRDPPSSSALPIFDAAHTRNAMARFNQTKFKSPAERAKARAKILRAAKKFGIDTSGFEKASKSSYSNKLKGGQMSEDKKVTAQEETPEEETTEEETKEEKSEETAEEEKEEKETTEEMAKKIEALEKKIKALEADQEEEKTEDTKEETTEEEKEEETNEETTDEEEEPVAEEKGKYKIVQSYESRGPCFTVIRG
ncbi:MAG: hypothetical protein ACTSPB_25980, partial [Candidatus Thorarchaeota archaeon]